MSSLFNDFFSSSYSLPNALLILSSLFFSGMPVWADSTYTAINNTEHKQHPPASPALTLSTINVDTSLIKQRQLYKKVSKDLERNSTTSFTQHHDALKPYPLYPYLQYKLITRNIKLENQRAIDYFFQNFGDIPIAKKLRQHWLKLLYRKKRWNQFLSYYDPDNTSTALACQYQYARYKAGEQEEALAGALLLWTVGKSQPDECNPIFERLIHKKMISDTVAWQRFTQAVLNHKYQLARYIQRFFTVETYINKSANYMATDRQPEQVGNYAKHDDHSAQTLSIIEHGIAHLARNNAIQAMKHWARYRQSHRFDDAAQSRMLPHFVKGLQRQGYDDIALSYLNDNITLADISLLEWQLRSMLRANSWLEIKQWIGGLPKSIREQERWRYWHARALLMTSNDPVIIDQAKTTFRELSRFRSFYGFLASDRVGNPYRMAERPLKLKALDVDTLAKTPALLRVRELFVQGENLAARREWFNATKNFDRHTWLLTALVAHDQHWYQQAIIAMSKARYWDDIDIRFPQPYREDFEKQARKVDLPLALLFAISRQESAFAADATSPAGARGLMQLMPRTAKQVARKHRISYKNRRQLFDVNKNIVLGSRYYKGMMRRFSNNRILATASYNAGPHRVAGWRKKTDGKLPYDVWIETIPFSETRQYVQNVLAYSVIFAHHLGEDQPILSPAEKQQLL